VAEEPIVGAVRGPVPVERQPAVLGHEHRLDDDDGPVRRELRVGVDAVRVREHRERKPPTRRRRRPYIRRRLPGTCTGVRETG
jgi:hypothetical protein